MAAPGEVIRKDCVDCHTECETLNIVIDEAVDSSDSRLSYEKWWNYMDAGIQDGTRTKRRMIHMVPEIFRQKESYNGCFDPLVVSIGPYHHGKSKLHEVERLKDSMALQFIKDCKMQFSAIYSQVQQISGAAREFYPKESVSKFDEKEFARLMFVDGCFVLQFIHSFLNKHEAEHMKSHIAAFVRRDLMLLENQLPYIVLKVLMNLRFEKNGGEELINNFIKSTRGVWAPPYTGIRATAKFLVSCYSKVADRLNRFRKGTADQRGQTQPEKNQPLHLLDLFLNKYINTKALMRLSFKDRPRDWYSYPAANELRTLGIHFRPSGGERFTDIKFASAVAAGLLFLPRIMIDDTTKSMLLNLVAYEASPDAPDDYCGLTSYICFMDSLIDQAEDVKELRSEGVVFNLLGSDQQAADLFNDIAQDLVANPYAFFRIKEGIEVHSKSRIRTWMAEFVHTHFSTPWTFIAFLAAAFAVVLTVLQTYIAVLDHCEDKGKEKGSFFCAFINNSRT